ncbi:MAG: DNA glycosylase AlkZ-like family protein [Gemmatimonadaceae bacterium]
MTRTPTSIEDLRRMAVTRSLGRPTTMARAIDMLGFVQADPIRAPARAQDLTLRARVRGYRAGDLERCYSTLAVEEDVFINYGFVTRSLQALMHPRMVPSVWPTARNRRAQAVLGFVRERGAVHPRDVDTYFSHGTVTNYWGGSSSATTHLLDALHYKGLLRVIRREAGIRIYAPHQHGSGPATPADRRSRLDALVDVVVGIYAPLPAASLSFVVRRLRYAVPHWRGELPSALDRAHRRLSRARVDGVVWYWPGDEDASLDPATDDVRLLTPFDPIVWDRRRFEMLWGWPYRFEAYTPVSKRRWGYYALPLLWREQVIGWANVSIVVGKLAVQTGYVSGKAPRDRRFREALAAESARMAAFLGLSRT